MNVARAEVVEASLTEGQPFERQFIVEPGKFVEVCSKLGKGQAVGWAFDAAGPVDFNIHFHVGKKVRYPEQLKAVKAAEGRLSAKLPQDYCWMWTNPGTAPLALRARLAR